MGKERGIEKERETECREWGERDTYARRGTRYVLSNGIYARALRAWFPPGGEENPSLPPLRFTFGDVPCQRAAYVARSARFARAQFSKQRTPARARPVTVIYRFLRPFDYFPDPPPPR